MGKTLQFMLITLFALLISVKPVAAYYIYYNTWYIYVIVVFVVIAISSCIGACVRHRRNQMYLEQQRVLMAQGINVTTTGGAVNGGFYPATGQYPQGQYPPPAPGVVQQPPAYYAGQAGAAPEKDPNMPPAYDEAVSAPDQPGNPPYPAQPAPSPYPAQTTPYPTQPIPYSTPYPTQPTPPYTAPNAPPS